MALGHVAVSTPVGNVGVTFSTSPRFGVPKTGPLFSTVNGFADRIASGDMAVISQLDQLRKVDKDKVAWQIFWDEMLPLQPMTAAQVALVLKLDPSKTGLVARSGAPVYAEPNTPLPSQQQVLQGLSHAASPTLTPSAGSGQPTNTALTNPMPALAALPWWMLALLVGGGAFAFYKLVLKKG
jgi:hypothetical protein